MSEQKRRAKRDERAGWAARMQGFTLVERDLAILVALGRAKALTTREIVSLCFGTRATAADRLRRLFAQGLVSVHVPRVNGPNVYALTEKGRRAVLERTDVEAGRLTALRALPARFDHLLGINRVHVLLVAATRGPAARHTLERFRSESELAAERHGALLGIVPDAVFELAQPASGAVSSFALEVDLGTESPTLVARKVRRYETFARANQPLYGTDIRSVLIVAPGERRVRSLARAVLPEAGAVVVRLADLDALAAETLFESFRRPQEWLAPAATSPYGGP